MITLHQPSPMTTHRGTRAQRLSWFVVAVVLGCVPAANGQAPGVVSEILVHGNHTTPDAEILALAGLHVGDPATGDLLENAAQQLRASGRFEAVDVRRRYRSIANPSEILVVLLVDERPPRSAGMWLPIVQHRDGYGMTYGARASFVDLFGPRTRASVPATWGAERRAALEIERTFERGLLTRARGTVSVSRRVNPRFDLADSRREALLQADRSLGRWLRVGAGGRVSDVTFAGRSERHRSAGAQVVFDTRLDPSFPRNAVQVTAAWEGMAFPRTDAHRLSADMRGYLGVGGPAVLALRGQIMRASSPLPLSEQPLLGGTESLRGYRAGFRAGDSLAALSAELRLPVTSPVRYGRMGMRTFVDLGTTWDATERLKKQRFDRGAGAGIYFGAAMFQAGADVAWPEHGRPRLHITLGTTF